MILAGGDSFFWFVLPLMRELLPAFFAVLLLAPAAFAMNATLAWVLVGLAFSYAAANVLVVRRTETGQRAVDQLHQEVWLDHRRGRQRRGGAGLRQPGARGAGSRRDRPAVPRGAVSGPRLVVILTVLTRATSTLAMAIFSVLAGLATAGRITVGEIVSFAGFAGLLITRMDVLSGAIARFMGAPTLDALHKLIEEEAGPEEDPLGPGARPCSGPDRLRERDAPGVA